MVPEVRQQSARSLAAWAMRRPVTLMMVLATVLVLGGVALYRTPLEFLMRLDVPFLWAYIPYPGATPQQVEQEVAIPAEGAFKTLRGVERVTTRSYEGSCQLALQFDWDTDMREATAEARDRIERLKLQLPREVERVLLRRFSTDQEPILRFAVIREENQDELARLARTVLRGRLQRVEGVADVEISGRVVEDVYVDFDQERLRSLNLGLYQLVGVLQSSGLDLGVGTLVDGGTKYYVRTAGQYRTKEELEDIVVAPNGMRLRDVATLRVAQPDGASSFTIDGMSGVFVQVRKESEANAVATCDRVRAELARIEEDPRFGGAEVFVFQDMSEIIRFILKQLSQAGLFGCLLSIVVLYVFLGRIVPTVLVALMIPLSSVVAFVYIFLMGYSLNVVTMAALVTAIGMLVDNAIVVLENMERHMAAGTPRLEAIRRGTDEVGMAITASTLTTIVVFVPTLYMDAGELTMFMTAFSGPVTVALVASLAFALTLMPLAESRLGHHEHRLRFAPMQWLAAGWRRGPGRWRPIEWSRMAYGGLLAYCLQRRTALLAALAGLALTTWYVPMKAVGMQELPDLDLREVEIYFRADPNYGYEGVQQDVERMEARLAELSADLQCKHIFVDRWGTGARLRLYLVKPEELPAGERPRYSTEEVRNIVSRVLPEAVPGGEVNCGVPSATRNDTTTVSVRMRGEDTAVLERCAQDFARLLAQQPDLTQVKTDREDDTEELRIAVDPARASAAGTSPAAVARTVGFALGGTDLPYLKEEGQEIRVRAQLESDDRRTKADLDNLSIEGRAGVLMPLNTLVRFERAEVAPGIFREDGKSVIGVVGTTQERDLERVRAAIEEAKARFSMPPGYDFSMGAEFDILDENLREFRGALWMAIALVYIVMAALFESVVLPLSIMSTVGLAFIGVYWSLHLTGTPMDTVSLIGSILMCGVIVNNGIVIVDRINQLRLEGMGRFEAIVEAGRNRYRPVLMTSLTTILGVLPLAVGTSEGGVLNSLGRALAGGLTVGTALTLVVVPIVYTLVDDVQAWAAAFAASVRPAVRRRSARV